MEYRIDKVQRLNFGPSGNEISFAEIEFIFKVPTAIYTIDSEVGFVISLGHDEYPGDHIVLFRVSCYQRMCAEDNMLHDVFAKDREDLIEDFYI